jgi:hypothetical protein
VSAAVKNQQERRKNNNFEEVRQVLWASNKVSNPKIILYEPLLYASRLLSK